MSAAIAAACEPSTAPSRTAAISLRRHISSMKEPLLDAIIEARDESEAPEDVMRTPLRSCINQHDVVMITGHSTGIARAVRVSHVELYVTEGPAAVEIMIGRSKTATFVPLSSTAAVMHRVSKLVLEAVAVSSSGDAVVAAGGFGLAAAAAAAGARVIIAAHSMALAPVPTETLNADVELESPAAVMPFADVQVHGGQLHVYAAKYDVIPASLISVIVTDAQTVRPEQLPSAVHELYAC